MLHYNVEISNKDFGKVDSILDHLKIVASKIDSTVIETTCTDRNTLIRNGISFKVNSEDNK